MSAPNFTPGPWALRRSRFPRDGGRDFGILATVGETEHCIAEAFEVVGVGLRMPAEANARLIAAAPELLEVLQAFVAAEECFMKHTRQERSLGASGWKDWLTDAYRQAVAAIAKALGQEATQ